MSKKGFTLLEVIIAIALITLVVVYLFGATGAVQKSNNAFAKHYDQKSSTTKIHQTFLHDFSQSLSSAVVSSQPFDRVILETTHSHFKIPQPYVAYRVKENVLYRLESHKPIGQRLDEAMLQEIKFEIISQNVTYFKVFVSKKDSFLVAVNEMLFEILK